MFNSSISYTDVFEAFEYQGWEKLSGAYHKAWGHITGAFVPPILSELGDVEGLALLDVATGPGYAARMASTRGANVIGLDFSPNMVRQASEINPGMRFEVGDVHDLPFDDSSFDCVISNFGVQHFSDLRLAFSEIARVLKPNGKCAFTIWADNRLNSVGDVLDCAVALHAEGISVVPPGPSYHELSDDAARKRLLVGAGFAENSLHTRLIMIPWTLSHIHEPFDAELVGSVRSGARLREQAPEPLARIRVSMAQLIEERYRESSGYVLPMAAYVVVGHRK